MSPRSLISAILLFCVFESESRAQAIVNRDYLKPPSVQRLPSIALGEAAVLGSGYAIPAASVRSPSMSDSSKQTSAETGVYYDLEYVESYASLSNVLSVSASASYGAPGASASARVNLLREARMSRTKAYVLVRMTVLTRKLSLAKSEMLPQALAVAKNEGENGFYPKYGDSFVSAIVYGGELLGLMEFTSGSDQSSESLRASISGGVSTVKANLDYESVIRTLTSNSAVKVKYAESGGSLKSDGIVTLTPDELIKRLKAFTPEVRSSDPSNKPLFAELREYSSAENVPAGTALVEPQQQSPLLEAIARTELLLREEFATTDGIISGGTLYPANLRNAAAARKAYVEYALIRIKEKIASISSRPLQKHEARLENFQMYRLERRLGLSSSVQRANAAGVCDLTEVDPDRVRSCLFQPIGPLTIDPWPVFTNWKSTRVIVGASLDALKLHVLWSNDVIRPPATPIAWVANPVIGCTDVNAWAANYCGKPVDGQKVIVKVDAAGPALGGDACGFTPFNVSCLTVSSPQRVLIQEISEMKPGTIQKKDANLRSTRTAGGIRVEVDVGSPSCAPAGGKFSIEGVALAGAKSTRFEEASYWRRLEKGDFTIAHTFPLSFADKLDQLAVQLGEVVCE